MPLKSFGQGEGSRFHDSADYALISAFPSVERVRAIAMSSLTSREPLLGPISQAFANDEEVRIAVGRHLDPFRLHSGTRS